MSWAGTSFPTLQAQRLSLGWLVEFTSLPEGRRPPPQGTEAGPAPGKLPAEATCRSSSSLVPPPSLAELHLGVGGGEGGRRGGMGDGPIGPPELKMPSRGGSWLGCRARCSQPPASPSSPFLSSPFTNFSHVPPPPAQLLPASPVGRSPRIVCTGSEDPRRPEGLGSPRPSTLEGSARASPPLARRTRPPSSGPLSGGLQAGP